MAEIIAEPSALSKIIPVSFKINDTDSVTTTRLATKKQFNTTDTDAWLSFTLDGIETTNGEFDLTLINVDENPSSIFHHTSIAFPGIPFHYKLDAGEDLTKNEIRHAGRWIGQVIIRLANGDTTTRQFDFAIAGHLLDGKEARVILIEDYNALIATITASKIELEGYNIDYAALIADVDAKEALREQAEIDRAATFDALVESEMVAQNVATKLTEKEATFAPRMLSLEEQLEHKAEEVDLNAQKSRIDTLVKTTSGSFYEKTTIGTTGALLVVSTGATAGQINLASVTPAASGYTPLVGDYVRLVYGVAAGTSELIDLKSSAKGQLFPLSTERIGYLEKLFNNTYVNRLYTSDLIGFYGLYNFPYLADYGDTEKHINIATMSSTPASGIYLRIGYKAKANREYVLLINAKSLNPSADANTAVTLGAFNAATGWTSLTSTSLATKYNGVSHDGVLVRSQMNVASGNLTTAYILAGLHITQTVDTDVYFQVSFQGATSEFDYKNIMIVDVTGASALDIQTLLSTGYFKYGVPVLTGVPDFATEKANINELTEAVSYDPLTTADFTAYGSTLAIVDGVLTATVTATYSPVFLADKSKTKLTYTFNNCPYIMLGGDSNKFLTIGLVGGALGKLIQFTQTSYTQVSGPTFTAPTVGDEIEITFASGVYTFRKKAVADSDFSAWFTLDMDALAYDWSYYSTQHIGFVFSGTTQNKISSPYFGSKKGLQYKIDHLPKFLNWAGATGILLGDSQVEWNLFPPKLQTALGLTTLNKYGIGGTCITATSDTDTNAFCIRYATMADGATIVMVEGATNDYGTHKPLGVYGDTAKTVYYGALKVLCEGLRTKYPTAKIFFFTPTQRNYLGEGGQAGIGPNNLGFTLKQYVDAMIDVCGDYSITVLDAYRGSGISVSNILNYTSDGLHLNDAGATKYVSFIAPQIEVAGK